MTVLLSNDCAYLPLLYKEKIRTVMYVASVHLYTFVKVKEKYFSSYVLFYQYKSNDYYEVE